MQNTNKVLKTVLFVSKFIFASFASFALFKGRLKKTLNNFTD